MNNTVNQVEDIKVGDWVILDSCKVTSISSVYVGVVKERRVNIVCRVDGDYINLEGIRTIYDGETLNWPKEWFRVVKERGKDDSV